MLMNCTAGHLHARAMIAPLPGMPASASRSWPGFDDTQSCLHAGHCASGCPARNASWCRACIYVHQECMLASVKLPQHTCSNPARADGEEEGVWVAGGGHTQAAPHAVQFCRGSCLIMGDWVSPERGHTSSTYSFALLTSEASCLSAAAGVVEEEASGGTGPGGGGFRGDRDGGSFGGGRGGGRGGYGQRDGGFRQGGERSFSSGRLLALPLMALGRWLRKRRHVSYLHQWSVQCGA